MLVQPEEESMALARTVLVEVIAVLNDLLGIIHGLGQHLAAAELLTTEIEVILIAVPVKSSQKVETPGSG